MLFERSLITTLFPEVSAFYDILGNVLFNFARRVISCFLKTIFFPFKDIYVKSANVALSQNAKVDLANFCLVIT